MRRAAILTIAVAVVSMLMAAGSNAQEPVTITIAPNQFVLAYQGTKLTVHTNILCGDAISESIEMHNLDGASIDPIGFKCDDRGYLVVKFSAEDVAMIVSPPSAELTMTGDLTNGGSFSATDAIRVK
jgi:hypothetical protein